MRKKALAALSIAASFTASGLLVSAPQASAEQCVGKTTEAEEFSAIGMRPGNAPAKGKKYNLNSCDAKKLADELRGKSEADAFTTAVIAAIPEIGPIAAAVWAGGHKLNGMTADDIQNASDNFTKGVSIVELDGTISARPQ